MEKSDSNRSLILFLFAIVICLGIVSFVFCILAEFNKTKADEVKFDGSSCSLPTSKAYRFGIAGLICLVTVQVLGNLIVSGLIFSAVKAGFRRKKSIAAFSGVLLTISWVSFGVAAIMISTAASMNRRQPYGKGWLHGDCYVVKNGVFGGAGFLVLVTLSCIVFTSGFTMSPQVLLPNKRKLQTQTRPRINMEGVIRAIIFIVFIVGNTNLIAPTPSNISDRITSATKNHQWHIERSKNNRIRLINLHNLLNNGPEKLMVAGVVYASIQRDV
ncbi:hypothetical protein V2J09_011933 [Rumex salicifolius]